MNNENFSAAFGSFGRALPFWTSRVARVVKAAATPKCDYVRGEMVASSAAAGPKEDALTAKVAESFLRAKADQQSLVGPYAPAADWNRMLTERWREPLEMLKEQDLKSLAGFLRNFFRNQAISGFWGEGEMFAGFANAKWPSRRLRARAMDQHVSVWRDALPDAPFCELAAPQVGNPWGYDVGGFLVFEPACEYHLEASQFANLLSPLASPVVLEIGGGFGGLAYYLQRRWSGIRYIGLDLPENIALQTYYIGSAIPEARILTYSSAEEVIDQSVWNQFDVVLMPNFMLPRVASETIDLVVNVRSLSEMPLATIGEYLMQVDRVGRRFFFHENLYRPRAGSLHGVPSTAWPRMRNFIEAFSVNSRWPKYGGRSGYPCRENLFVHRNCLA